MAASFVPPDDAPIPVPTPEGRPEVRRPWTESEAEPYESEYNTPAMKAMAAQHVQFPYDTVMTLTNWILPMILLVMIAQLARNTQNLQIMLAWGWGGSVVFFLLLCLNRMLNSRKYDNIVRSLADLAQDKRSPETQAALLMYARNTLVELERGVIGSPQTLADEAQTSLEASNPECRGKGPPWPMLVLGWIDAFFTNVVFRIFGKPTFARADDSRQMLSGIVLSSNPWFTTVVENRAWSGYWLTIYESAIRKLHEARQLIVAGHDPSTHWISIQKDINDLQDKEAMVGQRVSDYELRFHWKAGFLVALAPTILIGVWLIRLLTAMNML